MKKSRSTERFTRILIGIIANIAVVFSAVYTTFYILDHFNPRFHFVIGSRFFLAEYLFLLIPILCICIGVLYPLLLKTGIYRKKRFRIKRLLVLIVVDILAYGLVALAICTYSFDWLHLNGAKEEDVVVLATPTPVPTEAPTAIPMPTEIISAEATAPATETPEPTATPIPGLLGNKFAEKFTDGEVTELQNDGTQAAETLADGTVKTFVYSYASDQVCVEVYHYRKGKLEYTVSDIYARDVSCISTNYAMNAKYKQRTAEAGRAINAIVATNGDNFLDGDQDGLIIRNGSLIREKSSFSSDLCVLYYDGTIRCYDYRQDTFTTQEILQQYPYQAWYFGPKLLNEDGTAKSKFNSSLGRENPRTVLGYYEPGHYALIVVLGTREMIDIDGKNHGNGKSPGMTFAQLAELCEGFGMSMAYNLDGGGSSGMYYNNTIYGHNDRAHSDVVCVVDPKN